MQPRSRSVCKFSECFQHLIYVLKSQKCLLNRYKLTLGNSVKYYSYFITNTILFSRYASQMNRKPECLHLILIRLSTFEKKKYCKSLRSHIIYFYIGQVLNCIVYKELFRNWFIIDPLLTSVAADLIFGLGKPFLLYLTYFTQYIS